MPVLSLHMLYSENILNILKIVVCKISFQSQDYIYIWCYCYIYKLKFSGSQILSLQENVGDYSRVGEDAGGAKTSLFRRSTHCILHLHVAALSVFFCFSIVGAGLEPGLRHFPVNQQFLFYKFICRPLPPLPSPYLVSHWLGICIGEIAPVKCCHNHKLKGRLAMNASS